MMMVMVMVMLGEPGLMEMKMDKFANLQIDLYNGD